LNTKQDNVRERILEASMRLFLAKGFTGATTKELTVAAGVAKGTLYWHFKSKEQILEEILDTFSREFYDAAFEAANLCEDGFVKKFKVLYRFITEFARDKKELLLVSTTVVGEMAGTGTSAEKRIKEIEMKAHGFFKTLLEEGQKEGVVPAVLDTDLHAHIILANFMGMHIKWCLHGDSINAPAYARAYRDAIFRGMGITEW
jgi:TetR/AcrR family transcriptional regulator